MNTMSMKKVLLGPILLPACFIVRKLNGYPINLENWMANYFAHTRSEIVFFLIAM